MKVGPFIPSVQLQPASRLREQPETTDSTGPGDRVSTGDANPLETPIPLPCSVAGFRAMWQHIKERPFGPFQILVEAPKWSVKDPASPLNDPVGCLKGGTAPFIDAAVGFARDPLGPVLGAFGKHSPTEHDGAYFAGK